ncbi:MAG: hypothetical protein P4L69_00025 [Desulfosporosinus sp.]|nr:hypothetical protein [Desulfosporosinus sp.]
MDSAHSVVEWASIPTDPVAITNLRAAVNKLLARKAIAERNSYSLETLQDEWGETVNVRKALFYKTTTGLLYPKHKPIIAIWKALVTDYCTWHEITKLEQIVALWEDIVDAFISCPDFDRAVDPEFRAWIYGCMCKFVLQKKKEEYSPEHPAYLMA